MSRFRLSTIVSLFALLLCGVTWLPASRAQAPTTFYVRVPIANVADATSLGLQPELALDYGSFHWLLLDEDDFHTLARSGIPFNHEIDAAAIHVAGYDFDPLREGEPPFSPSDRSSGSGAGLRLVRFAGPTNDRWLEELSGAGLSILQYYPHFTYLVWGSVAQVEAIASLETVRWTGAFHPGYKINGDLSLRSGRIANVDIFFYNDGRVRDTLAALKAVGATILNTFPAQPDRRFYDAIVEVDATQLQQIAQLETVLWLGYASPEPSLEDEMAAQILAGNYPGGVPQIGYEAYLGALGYDGSGVTWAIIDTGVDYAHPDLAPRIAAGYSYPGACETGNPGDDCPNGGHGTHVAGIVGADAASGYVDGSGFLYGLGIAPGVSLFASNSLSASAWPPSGGWQEHSKRALLGGASGGNNSWTTGEGTAHGYQSSERIHDFIVRDGNFDTTAVAEPFTEVFSAGNSGPTSYSLTAPKEAKNLIVSAASLNYRIGDIDAIYTFSSRGPTSDGRWVPTITAPGAQIASTKRIDGAAQCYSTIANTNGLYAYCSGTSMAAPHTSGAIVLATEWWRGFNNGADPSPAMTRALLVNSAVDMGNADIPNINEGWGRVNITDMINPAAHVLYYDQETTFNSSGEEWMLDVGILDPDQPLKVTLAWSDAPGAVGANPALVNNLDLTVTSGGAFYRGNVFSSGWSTSGGAADAINNLENVYVQNPGASASIAVSAANIAGDGVPYSGDNSDQDFALICYNCALSPSFTVTASPPSREVCAPASASYDVVVNPMLAYSAPVTLSASGVPPGAGVSFSSNALPPPYASVLTVSGTGNAAPGDYAITINGTGSGYTSGDTVQLTIKNSVPAPVTLITPADRATDVSLTPTFNWSESPLSDSYLLQVATDSSFTDVVYAHTTSATTHVLAGQLLAGTDYYWRVRAANACGASGETTVFEFTTAPAPGGCGPYADPVQLFSDDFEGGSGGWTQDGTINAWLLSSVRTHSGSKAFHAPGSDAIGDERLVSPAVYLPSSQPPLVLEFWNYRAIEDSSIGCYDGGLLEISTDGGTDWTQIPGDGLLTDPYDGVISSSHGNPLAGREAWCGNPQGWLQSIVDLDPYAGQTVQFRFRFGTDNSVDTEGWYVDDVRLQACAPRLPGLLLSPESSTTVGLPGLTVYHTFTLKNSGGIPDSYTLTISGNAWATSSNLGTTPLLSPGSTIQIVVWVSIPLQPGAANDTFTLTAASSADPGLTAQAAGQTTILQVEDRFYAPHIVNP